jgi:predicted PurR-regulated permease PerM
MSKKKKRPQKNTSRQSEAGTPAAPLASDSKAALSKAQIAKPSNLFTQYFSFALLLVIIILVGIVFYEVMANFLVPLFLAAIMVVVFRPWYDWIRKQIPGRDSIAALLTSLSVLLIVLVPLGTLLTLAAVECQQVLRQVNSAKVIRSAGLDLPPAVRAIESEIQFLGDNNPNDQANQNLHRVGLYEIKSAAADLASVWDLPKVESGVAPTPAGDLEDDADSTTLATSTPWQEFNQSLAELAELQTKSFSEPEMSDAESKVDREVGTRQPRFANLHEYKLELGDLAVSFDKLKADKLGGKPMAWVASALNPTAEQSEAYLQQVTSYLRDSLFSIGGRGLTVSVLLLASTVVMVVAFYFFLLDGRSMLDAFKGLSPIDDDHEQELVDEFARVSRAVVMATLLSALAQGLLAGVGFYFAGLDSIFLLTVLSAVLAMVPFVGAAAVWVPCALYLYFVDNDLTTALVLAVYGAGVISMADNVIKPIVLHGQSNLHPLFAFLSVFGGVTALGPIGILIGPMVVAFLQTLLKILRREVNEMGLTPD